MDEDHLRELYCIGLSVPQPIYSLAETILESPHDMKFIKVQPLTYFDMHPNGLNFKVYKQPETRVSDICPSHPTPFAPNRCRARRCRYWCEWIRAEKVDWFSPRQTTSAAFLSAFLLWQNLGRWCGCDIGEEETT